MEMNANIHEGGDIREYTRDGYAVWTTLERGVPINKKEVVIKGRKCQRTNTAMAKVIGMACKDWVTRVQVIRWPKG